MAKKKIVMLDPGHGGKDSGAVGYGRHEADDVLKLAKKVKSRLTPYCTVKMTRTTDRYDSPSEKARKGNAAGADFFLSMHRNSAGKDAKGYESLIYKKSGAGYNAGKCISDEMERIGFKDRGVKERKDLAVLHGTSMPALLTESGFITNKADNELFTKRLNLISDAHACAVLKALGIIGGKGSKNAAGAYYKTVTIKKKAHVRTERKQASKSVAVLRPGDKIKVYYVLKNSAGNLWGSVIYNGSVRYICMNKV